jgi:hypothetical protein
MIYLFTFICTYTNSEYFYHYFYNDGGYLVKCFAKNDYEYSASSYMQCNFVENTCYLYDSDPFVYELPTLLNIFDEKYNLNDIHTRKVFIEEFIFNISLQKLV